MMQKFRIRAGSVNVVSAKVGIDLLLVTRRAAGGRLFGPVSHEFAAGLRGRVITWPVCRGQAARLMWGFRSARSTT